MPEPTPPPRRPHFWLAASAWTIFVVYGSLVPLRFQHVDLADAIDRFSNLPPLGFGLGTRADLVANLLLFIPFTFLWMAALTLDRRRAAAWIAALVMTALAAAAAVALEFTQIWFAGRTVSKNDIVAESAGGLIGVILWLAAGPRIVAWLRSFARMSDRRSALRWLLGAYIAGFAIYSVIPLDLTISLTDLYGKFRDGRVLLVPFAYSYDSAIAVVYQFFADIATFLPVGAWVWLVSRDRLRGRSPFLCGVIGGAAIAAAIEFAQLLVLSRFTDTTDIVLGALGSGIGAWWMAKVDRHVIDTAPAADRNASHRGIFAWLAVLTAYSLLLVAGFLYPFEWTDDRAVIRERYEGFFGTPLAALYWGSEFNAIKQVLVRFLLFATLGLIVARLASLARSASGKAAAYAAGLGYAAILALGIEATQIFMPSRIADATEVIVCWMGVAAGVMIARLFTRLARDEGGRGTGVAMAPRSTDRTAPR